MKTTTLISLATSFLIGCTLFTNSTRQSSSKENTMFPMMIHNPTLYAYEQTRPFIGRPPTANRDIGFADVFLTLENQAQADTTITIQQIEIHDVATGKVYLTSKAPQTIQLKPLENSVNDFHLTNKIGYPNPARVKAVITYLLNGNVEKIESNPVDVTRR